MYSDFSNFSWDHLHEYLWLHCPALSIITATVCDLTPHVSSKPYQHIVLAVCIGLHGRSQEMFLVQFVVGFMLKHGGCTERDIERLSKIGLSFHPTTLHRKLVNWQNILDSDILSARDSWANGGYSTYQIIGDNWDKDILPSYKTSDRKTLSLHLFKMYAILDRVVPPPPLKTVIARLITLNLQTSFLQCLSKSNLCRSCALLSQHQ